MENQRFRVEIAAAVVATCAITGAAISGWVMHRETPRANVSQAAIPGESQVTVVPEILSLPARPLPFVTDEVHITNWDRLWGGAFPGAKMVRTVAVHQYVPPPQQPLQWK